MEPPVATAACPTCYRRLPSPGRSATGWPLVLPSLVDITAVACQVDDERITVEFASGLVASRPTSSSWRLAAASAAEREAVEIIDGHHLRWEAVDEDIDTSQFLGMPEDLGSARRGADFRPYRRRPDAAR